MSWEVDVHICYQGHLPPGIQGKGTGSIWVCNEGPRACGRRIKIIGYFFGVPLLKDVTHEEVTSESDRPRPGNDH